MKTSQLSAYTAPTHAACFEEFADFSFQRPALKPLRETYMLPATGYAMRDENCPYADDPAWTQ